jgi:signal recognition particle subunit SRP54
LSYLEKLGTSLAETLRKVTRASTVDEKVVEELVRDLQRTLLKADVNVQLVLDLTKVIKERVLTEELPPGISRRTHLVKVVYEELTKILGDKAAILQIKTTGSNVLMLVGIQGSGKTTATVKLARFFKKRGLKTGLICADNFRPGAYAQLKQLSDKINVPVYADEKNKNAAQIARDGIEYFKREKYYVIIVDTAGRHKNETELMTEMKEIADAVKPDEIILIIDSNIGQQVATQAKVFNEATKIGSILITKLDGSAKGGGAISAVAAIGAPIKFIGTGEKIDDLEVFVPSRFVGRLLGMGDLESLIKKINETEVVSQERAKSIMSGKVTLEDMYEQMKAIKKMGNLKQVLNLIPGLSYRFPKETIDIADEKLEKWQSIIQSMTNEEKTNPDIINASRIKRIARGSGTDEKEVKQLVKQFFLTKKFIKTMPKRKLSKMFYQGLEKKDLSEKL